MSDVIDKARALIETLRAIKVCVVRANRDILGVRPINAAQEAIRSGADLLTALADHADAMKVEQDALRQRVAVLTEALRNIAIQKRTDELITECDVEYADFEEGYDLCIDRARAALQSESA